MEYIKSFKKKQEEKNKPTIEIIKPNETTILKMPREKDNEYHKRVISHIDAMRITKHTGKVFVEEAYSYPLTCNEWLYYPLFRVELFDI